MISRQRATWAYEKKLWKKGLVVIGVDEVGRGALAGPLTVGAVCFKPDWMDDSFTSVKKAGIADSKMLSAKKREELAPFIKSHALATATASCSVESINTKGVTKALCRIFNDVIQTMLLLLPPLYNNTYILIDGTLCPPIQNIKRHRIQTLVGGDTLSISIAAASILAKVDRDSQMTTLSETYPPYQWARNKGYGTAIHIAALLSHGATVLHRTKYIDRIVL